MAQPRTISWPPSVRLYVQRSFEQENAISGIENPAIEHRLKLMPTEAAAAGAVEHA